MKTRLVYVGDYGPEPISPQTLEAYGTAYLAQQGKTWRRSKTKREAVERMYADLAAVQRYFWMRDEERREL